MCPIKRLFPLVAGLTATITAGQAHTLSERPQSGAPDTGVEIRCAQEMGEELGMCRAWVDKRDKATLVIVRFPNGFSRFLFFKDAAFQRGNTTMSGTGTDTDWSLSDGIYRIRVDDQQYEVPEALISGQ